MVGSRRCVVVLEHHLDVLFGAAARASDAGGRGGRPRQNKGPREFVSGTPKRKRPLAGASGEEKEEEEEGSDPSSCSDGEGAEECYFSVRSKEQDTPSTEQDLILKRIEELARAHIRQRPTLPASWEDAAVPWTR